MNRHHPLAPLCAGLLALALVAGCSKESPVSPASAEEPYFQTVVSGDDAQTRDLVTSDVEALDESTEFNLKAEALQKQITPSGASIPQRFGRSITKVIRSIIRPSTMEGDSVAIVHTQTVIEGRFVIRRETPSGFATIHKPFTETLHRDLRFERERHEDWDEDDDKDEDDDHQGKGRGPFGFRWKLVAVSIINGGTLPPSPAIQSVELITPLAVYTVTDPDNYFMASLHPWKIKMPKLNNQPITLRVTITSASPDTEVVVLHHLVTDEGLRKQGFTLVSETGGAGQFTRVYELNWSAKIKGKKKFGYLVVSALTHASVYDDDPQLYSSTIWGIPYLPSE